MSVSMPNHPKIITFDQAAVLISRAKTQGRRAVLAQGVFDVIHIGHTTFLRDAKAGGDLLFVGLEPDESVKLNKGTGRPLHYMDERLQVIAELASVDYVFGFEDAIPYGSMGTAAYSKRLELLRPSALALSLGDSLIDIRAEGPRKLGIEVVLARGVWREYSSTKLLRALNKDR
jgi:cytidyltransferase-like protein